MEAPEVHRAVEAGRTIAADLGLPVEDVAVINNSDRVALRLTPCDVLARVAPSTHQGSAGFEVEVARRLTDAGGPVAALEPRVDPRVYVRDSFAISLWRYYEPEGPEIGPADYAGALWRLHAALRQLDLVAPDFTDRVADALKELGEPERTPDLSGSDRELLSDTLRRLATAVSTAGSPTQLLHGEPHAGNLLRTRRGPLFVDLETCCRGPVEFDLAHAPADVAEQYPGADGDLVCQSRTLMWAMVTTWRWRREDQFPDRAFWRLEGLNRLRSVLEGGSGR